MRVQGQLMFTPEMDPSSFLLSFLPAGHPRAMTKTHDNPLSPKSLGSSGSKASLVEGPSQRSAAAVLQLFLQELSTLCSMSLLSIFNRTSRTCCKTLGGQPSKYLST